VIISVKITWVEHVASMEEIKKPENLKIAWDNQAYTEEY
jgi:hypothetical protein